MVMVEFNNLSSNFTGICYNDKNKWFIKKDKDHRYYGPAYIYEKYRQWWLNDYFYGDSYHHYNQKQFIKNINRQWFL